LKPCATLAPFPVRRRGLVWVLFGEDQRRYPFPTSPCKQGEEKKLAAAKLARRKARLLQRTSKSAGLPRIWREENPGSLPGGI
jgi:hypothetical protein